MKCPYPFFNFDVAKMEEFSNTLSPDQAFLYLKLALQEIRKFLGMKTEDGYIDIDTTIKIRKLVKKLLSSNDEKSILIPLTNVHEHYLFGLNSQKILEECSTNKESLRVNLKFLEFCQAMHVKYPLTAEQNDDGTYKVDDQGSLIFTHENYHENDIKNKMASFSLALKNIAEIQKTSPFPLFEYDLAQIKRYSETLVSPASQYLYFSYLLHEARSQNYNPPLIFELRGSFTVQLKIYQSEIQKNPHFSLDLPSGFNEHPLFNLIMHKILEYSKGIDDYDERILYLKYVLKEHQNNPLQGYLDEKGDVIFTHTNFDTAMIEREISFVSDLLAKQNSAKLQAAAVLNDDSFPASSSPVVKDFSRIGQFDWKDIKLIFYGNRDYIKIDIKGQSQKYHFSELGFKDIKKGDMYNQLWETLLDAFAACHGGIDHTSNIDPEIKKRLKTDVSRLRLRMKSIFGLQTDPFGNYSRNKAYKTKFSISIQIEK